MATFLDQEREWEKEVVGKSCFPLTLQQHELRAMENNPESTTL